MDTTAHLSRLFTSMSIFPKSLRHIPHRQDSQSVASTGGRFSLNFTDFSQKGRSNKEIKDVIRVPVRNEYHLAQNFVIFITKIRGMVTYLTVFVMQKSFVITSMSGRKCNILVPRLHLLPTIPAV